MTTKQDIVPIILQDDKKTHQHTTQRSTQKLVARLKCTDSELFIYESIHDSTLRLLLSELYTNETH